MKKINYTLFIMLVSLNFLFSKGSTISGYVKDLNSGDPLTGANVILEKTQNPTSITTLGSATDLDGFYKIQNIPIGEYSVSVLYIGYENQKKIIKVKADQNYTYNFDISPSAIQLQETTVTGTQRKEKITEAPASMEIISSREIRREASANLGSFLKGLKGVDYTASGVDNYAISIRGFNSSFSTRLLTLTDGRVANIPALRAINYSAIPQSTEDVENIEVVLGPSTALYGANAHSGVVNITSKSPAKSEGFILNISGTNDDRDLLKIDGRWAKKFNNWSMKISGGAMRAQEWPYISEQEWFVHRAPIVGHPYRKNDGKDNNPWSNVSSQGNDINDGIWGINKYGDSLLIGDGEAMNTGDPDNDGVMGEDWYNGYDDDGDGQTDEDYFIADGIDNDGDGIIDENIDYETDQWADGVDNDGNGLIDDVHERTNSDGSSRTLTNLQGNLLVFNGRVNQYFPNGDLNPFHDENYDYSDCAIGNLGVPDQNCHIYGEYKWDEDNFTPIFDTWVFDYGIDGLPGDPFIDEAGDLEFQIGESLNNNGTDIQDCGLDGECPYLLFGEGKCSGFISNPNYPGYADTGECNGEWEPGDRWVDNGDGIPDYNEDGYNTSINEQNYLNLDSDVWPIANGIWDVGEVILDCGNDGLCPGDDNYPGQDPGENDDILRPYDTGEKDGILDSGDGKYGGEGDYQHNWDIVTDANGDGVSDYPDFEVKNLKGEIRIDYDPNDDFNLSIQSGSSWVKTQQVTGVGRFLSEGYKYDYYQLRSRYKNWFAQAYLNKGNSGQTRGYGLGNKIKDASKNYAAQIQHNFNINDFFTTSNFQLTNTKIIWGIDYFETAPETFGTILNDGPNGYDNDGDSYALQTNGIDDDNNGIIDDIGEPGEKAFDGIDNNNNGLIDESGEGVDEEDEYNDVDSYELGFYFQSKTYLTSDKKLELILASRFDYHEHLDDGVKIGPKIGLMYDPNDKFSFRATYGRAYNVPTVNTLHQDLYIGKLNIFDVYFKGNKDGSPYYRTTPNDIYTKDISPPIYYDGNGIAQNLGNYFEDESENCADIGQCYQDRIQNAPFFFNFSGSGAPIDYIPLDTSKFLVFISELNGDGVLYTPIESLNIPDVEPIKAEQIQTFELGFKGRVGLKTVLTADYYISNYTDFFSSATIITPTIVQRTSEVDAHLFNGAELDYDNLNFMGTMPTDTIGSFYPYSTAWNGLDDDNDWATWAETAGWEGDSNNDGNPVDPGEWGFTYIDENGETQFLHPHEVNFNGSQIPTVAGYETATGLDLYTYYFNSVGVDEWSVQGGLDEAEQVLSTLENEDGTYNYIRGVTKSPPNVILSYLNYGNVWMQGLDIGFTHFLTDKIIIDGNIAWYNSTKYYNELTKRNDPINAPKLKYNFGFKWDSKFGGFAVNYRHVDKFEWKDGIWAGIIGPYDLVDVLYNFEINNHLSLNLSAMNIFNNMHRELVGGAKLGRQITLRLSTSL